MGLTDDEKSLLEKLTEKAKAPDAPDHEVEIYDTKSGKGARVPMSVGAKWLHDVFGIGDAPAATAPPAGAATAPATPPGTPPAKVTYFGKAS